MKIRTIHYGLGAIGLGIVRLALERTDIEIVGAIDADPVRVGRDIGEVAGLDRNLGITVAYDPEPVLKEVGADVVFHATGLSLTAAYPQIIQAVDAEKNVISSCEELAFPWTRYPDLAQKLHQRARQAGVRILGAGVNPGFLMDTVPLLLATACQQVRSVRVTRVVDLAPERLELRNKVGVGLNLEGFQRGASNGSIGHLGLRESMFMIADSLGWRLDDVSETIEPLIAPQRIKTDYFVVDKTYVMGLRQRARGLLGGREVVRLEVEVSLGAGNPRDEIVIDGTPPLKVVIPGGIQEELATTAIMVNCLPAIVQSRAFGLLSMRDMPVAPYHGPGLQAIEIFE